MDEKLRRRRFLRPYTHARQFPHLSSMDDAAIRVLARRGMTRRPGLIAVMKFRNVVVFSAMIAAAATLERTTSLGLGGALMVAGGGATPCLLCWNLVWVNTVIFALTKDEVDRSNQ